MKIYLKDNVYDKALERIEWLFNEFDTVVVGYSAGKDSTICLELSLIVARKLNKLPLKVMFLDQETEWQATIDLVEEVMSRKEVDPYWYQIPLVMSNNASSTERFTKVWDEDNKEDWIRPKHPISIKENKYNCDRFHEMFGAIAKVDWGEGSMCYISGVRTEESPKRFVALTHHETYKGRTYGRILSSKINHYTMYPIYDWSYTDVWKAIHDNNWKYNTVYDELYRQGYSIPEMRVSNLHHETALSSLLKVQEIEPDTWNRITNKIDGANTIKHIKHASYACPRNLPPMFESWNEYCHHLIKYIIQDDANKDKMLKLIENKKEVYSGKIEDQFYQAIITTILSSDWDGSKFANWEVRPDVYGLRKFRGGDRSRSLLLNTQWYTNDEIQELIDIHESDKTSN